MSMVDPRTFWLNAANAALGVVVGAAVLTAIFCVLREVIARIRRYHALSRELNGDMKHWFGSGRYPNARPRRH